MEDFSREETIRLIEQQIRTIDTEGSDDVRRLRHEVERSPKEAEYWFELGLALNQAAMQRDYLLIHKTQIENPDAEMIEVDCAASTPLFEEAIHAFRTVLQLEPDYYGVHTQLGIVLSNLHRLAEAEAEYLQALKDDEEDFSAAYYLGLNYRDMGDEDKAQHFLQMAHDLNPDDEMFNSTQGFPIER